MKDYYYIMGLDQGCSQDDIKEVYRKMSKKLHPDLNQGDEYFDNRFKDLKEAFDTLRDPVKRIIYDAKLLHFKGAAEMEKSQPRRQAGQRSEPKPAVTPLKVTPPSIASRPAAGPSNTVPSSTVARPAAAQSNAVPPSTASRAVATPSNPAPASTLVRPVTALANTAPPSTAVRTIAAPLNVSRPAAVSSIPARPAIAPPNPARPVVSRAAEPRPALPLPAKSKRRGLAVAFPLSVIVFILVGVVYMYRLMNGPDVMAKPGINAAPVGVAAPVTHRHKHSFKSAHTEKHAELQRKPEEKKVVAPAVVNEEANTQGAVQAPITTKQTTVKPAPESDAAVKRNTRGEVLYSTIVHPNVTGIVQLRARDAYNANIVASIPANSKVLVLERGQVYYRVCYDKSIGFVPKWALDEQ
jgi:hypothetical protein